MEPNTTSSRLVVVRGILFSVIHLHSASCCCRIHRYIAAALLLFSEHNTEWLNAAECIRFEFNFISSPIIFIFIITNNKSNTTGSNFNTPWSLFPQRRLAAQHKVIKNFQVPANYNYSLRSDCQRGLLFPPLLFTYSVHDRRMKSTTL